MVPWREQTRDETDAAGRGGGTIALMRRVLRYVGNGLVLLSLLLCIGSVGAWVRSYWTWTSLMYIDTRTIEHLSSASGWVSISDEDRNITKTVVRNLSGHWSARELRTSRAALRLGDIPHSVPGIIWRKEIAFGIRTVAVRWPWVVFLFTIAPALWFARFVRHRRRSRPGCCACGYDLTGNVSGVCPECGKAITA